VHDRIERKKVSGYEVAGEFRMPLTYNTTLDDVISLVDVSGTCRQFIKWECISAAIKNPRDVEDSMTYWANRYGENRFYWGGSTPSFEGCACGINQTCAKPEKRCQCDANDQELREDYGYIEEKADLPLTTFYAGDTGRIILGIHIVVS
jgi:contactin associated protein 1